MVLTLDVCERDPVRMWQKLATNYNKVTDYQRASARKAFLNFKIKMEDNYLRVQHQYNELLRQITVLGGEVTNEDKRDTLLGALPRKYDVLKEAYFPQGAVGELPHINYIWGRMYDIETTRNQRAEERGASALAGEVYYQSTKGRGIYRGRGKGVRGGLGGGRGVVKET